MAGRWLHQKNDETTLFFKTEEICPLAIPNQTSTISMQIQSLVQTPWYLLKLSSINTSLGGSVGCAVLLETRRSRVQTPPRSATFFHGDWSWNIFYGHSLPSADSRRAVVSFCRKNVHIRGLILPSKRVVRLTDRAQHDPIGLTGP